MEHYLELFKFFFYGFCVPIPFFVAVYIARQFRKYFTAAANIN